MAKQREGYLLVDHSASPGMTETEARVAGYDPTLCGEGKKFEAATLTCAHCKATVIKNPNRIRPRPSCIKCGGLYICDLCEATTHLADYSHMPFEKFRDLTLNGKQPVLIRKPELGMPPELILPPKPIGDSPNV